MLRSLGRYCLEKVNLLVASGCRSALVGKIHSTSGYSITSCVSFPVVDAGSGLLPALFSFYFLAPGLPQFCPLPLLRTRPPSLLVCCFFVLAEMGATSAAFGRLEVNIILSKKRS